ncbi:HAMP domain-containing methyl-accepting chemotaxis protein [Desulfofustis limnaeus]|uniref:Methyl-accepting chemotaxis protein n=1 Tax=Desulfofustis limnaeus TaxID=2740163 RepID=A0ABM7WBV7_9BACT|nr:methyl-accepting chemotaxis protein [Desulfofustis limnaeus]BDD88381.1 methyl-accepting chemotaxis protein [Desulfofustis limnaeus]
MFKKMNLAMKIGCGFGAIILLLIIVSVVSWRGLGGVADGFGEYRRLARNNNLSARLQAQTLMMQMNIKDYIITNSDKDVEEYRSFHTKMEEFLAQAKEQIKNPERAALIAQQEADAKTYDEAFKQVVELVKERHRLANEELIVIGPDMEKKLTEVMQSARDEGDVEAAYRAGVILRHMLLGRLFVEKFLNTNDKEDEERARDELTETVNQAADLQRSLLHPERKRLSGEVAELAGQYSETFDKIARGISTRNDLIINTLDVVGPKMAEDVETIKLSYLRDQDALGPVVQALSENSVRIVLIVAAVALLIGIAAAFIITRSITTPVARMMKFVETLAGGDFTSKLTIEQEDEIGKMSRALGATAQELGAMIKQIVASVNTLSASSTELSAVSAQLSSNAENASTRSTGVASAAEEMSTNMSSVSAAMEQSASNVGMVATATEEMTSTVHEIAQNAAKAKDISEQAVDQSQKTSAKMNELGQAADKIGKVTEAITEISEQTNLLALNATIEAARAGEAGKGFAVVANEIKELAKQTADATVDIKNQIEEMQRTTSGTVTDIKTITEVINEINEIITTIATAVEQQSAATSEISENIAQASAGIAEVNENVAQSSVAIGDITKDIGEISSTSEEVSQGSHNVRESAGELSRLAEQLDELVRRFKVA